jgi:hypothetical protein
MKIQIIEKNVYGKILLYPFDETAEMFAKLLNVKTFSHATLCGIEALGYEIINVTPKQIPA